MDECKQNHLVEDASRVADLNLVENLWHELKEYICRRSKPTVTCIIDFWNQQKCNKYIDHLKKAIPCVIEVDGHATGY